MLIHKVKIEIERLVYLSLEIRDNYMFFYDEDNIEEYDEENRTINLKLYERNDNGITSYQNLNYTEIKFCPIEKNCVSNYGQYLFIYNKSVVFVNYNLNNFSFRIDDYQKNNFIVEQDLR